MIDLADLNAMLSNAMLSRPETFGAMLSRLSGSPLRLTPKGALDPREVKRLNSELAAHGCEIEHFDPATKRLSIRPTVGELPDARQVMPRCSQSASSVARSAGAPGATESPHPQPCLCVTSIR